MLNEDKRSMPPGTNRPDETGDMALLGEMAATVAHEVRNALAGIGGAIQVVADRLQPSGREKAIVREICIRIDGLDSMMADLLFFARPAPIRTGPVEIEPLIVDVVRRVRQDPEWQDLLIEQDIRPCTARADGKQLAHALYHLLINSAQTTGNEGHVRVAAGPSPEGCVIEIADDGPGIGPEEEERLFEPFFPTRHRGMGLGLAVVKRVIDALGGTIRYSQEDTRGAAFTITLPLAKPSNGNRRGK